MTVLIDSDITVGFPILGRMRLKVKVTNRPNMNKKVEAHHQQIRSSSSSV